MGYLTTFTIYNDGIELIRKDSNEFCEKLKSCALEMKTDTFGHRNFTNLVKVQKSRHADDPTVYVHMGNTLCEMNAYSKETKNIMDKNPEFFKEMLDYMKGQVKKLEKNLKEHGEHSNL
ncbi:MAG: hypothetical protein KKB62_00955 [Nanoarchaeota archaeon]|nr:hypothetical protein [Nanoarchaeota archaeon]